MGTEKHTIARSWPESDGAALRLGNAAPGVLPAHDTQTQHEPLSVNDPRWVFVVLVRRELERGPLGECDLDRMIRCGARLGIAPMQARALIAVVEQRAGARWAGPDLRDAILRIPAGNHSPDAELSDRARWMVFGVLICWAIMIAGLMQLVA